MSNVESINSEISSKQGKYMGAIVFFDGVCNLCSFAVQTLIKMDKHGKLKFASLQSEFATQHLPKQVLAKDSQFSTLVFYTNNNVFIESEAILEIAKHIGGFWKVAVLGYLIPVWIRDPLYRYISRNRYKWFGRKENCWIPGLELKSRFL